MSPCPAADEARRLAAGVAAQPGQPRPVLVPAIHEDRHPRIRRDVADARQRQRIVAALRLVVERRVEDRLVEREHEADRHEPRSPVRRDRAEDRASGGGEERSLVVGQHAAMMAPAAYEARYPPPAPQARTLVFDVTSTASAAGRRCRDRAADRGAGHRTTRPCAGAVRPADRIRRAHPGGHLDGRAIGGGDGHARSDRRHLEPSPHTGRDRGSARDR